MTVPGPAGPVPAPHVPAVLPGRPSGAPVVAPAPPPGPGVTPPFPAPPAEGRSTRLWVGLGVGGLALVLFCGAGAAAVVGLVVTGTRAVNEQAQVVVGNYLDAVRDEDYPRAYRLLCDEAQDDENADEFATRVRAQQPISSYDVGEASLAAELVVPVDVTYRAGGSGTLRFYLAQDGGTGQLEVCEIEG